MNILIIISIGVICFISGFVLCGIVSGNSKDESIDEQVMYNDRKPFGE